MSQPTTTLRGSLRIAFVLFSSLFAHAQTTASKPPPDLLVFTNGDQLTGTFERIAGGNVVFKSDMAGEVTISLDKVKQLRANGDFAVLRKDKPIPRKPVTTGTIALEGTDFKLMIPNVTEETIPTKEVGYVIDKATYVKETNAHPSFFYGWNGAITGGATFVNATQEGKTFTAGIALVRAIPTVDYLPKRSRTILGLIETYGSLTEPTIPQTNPPTPTVTAKTSIFHAGLEHDIYLTSRLYALGTISFDHNYSQGLDFQQIYGGGLGWTAIQSAIQEFDIRGDIHYERQTFFQLPPPAAPTPELNLIGATIGENYLRHLPGKLVLTEAANFIPAFNNSNAYSANASIGLVLPVYHRFALNFLTSDNYLNNPTPGYKKNSYQFVTGVTYTLH